MPNTVETSKSKSAAGLALPTEIPPDFPLDSDGEASKFREFFYFMRALHEYESRSFGESLKILQKKTIPPRSGQILGRKTSNDLKQIITRIFTRFGFAPIFKGALSSASPFCYIVSCISLENLRFVINASNEVQCCLRYIIVS